MSISVKGTLTRVLHFLLALVATAALCCLAASQFNLARLSDLGVSVPFSDRLAVTAHDLINMGPLYGSLIGAALVIAFPVTGLLVRWFSSRRAFLYALAGAVAIAVMLVIMKQAFGITLIAATRTASGFASQVVAGAVGGWLFAYLTKSRVAA